MQDPKDKELVIEMINGEPVMYIEDYLDEDEE